MGLSLSIPQLKNELPNGVHECVISNFFYLKEGESPIMYAGNYIIVLSFACGGMVSEKQFRLGDENEYKVYTKFLAILGFKKHDMSYKSEIVGKRLMVFVQKVITRETGEYYYKIVNFKPTGKNYKHIKTEIYV
jgi:hypothetical protein